MAPDRITVCLFQVIEGRRDRGFRRRAVGGACYWLLVERDEKGLVAMHPIQRNSYRSPVHLVDDLLRRDTHDVIIGWDAHERLLPLLVESVVPPHLPGPFLSTTRAAEVVSCARDLRSLGIAQWPVVTLRDGVERLESTWWGRFGAWVLERLGWTAEGRSVQVRRDIGAWLGDQVHTSELLPSGVVGLRWRRSELLDALRGRCFDPFDELRRQVDHSDPVRLHDVAGDPGEDARNDTPSSVIWSQGDRFAAVHAAQAELNLLREALHIALSSSNLRTRRLNAARPPVWVAPTADQPGARYRYALPVSWWDKLTALLEPT